MLRETVCVFVMFTRGCEKLTASALTVFFCVCYEGYIPLSVLNSLIAEGTWQLSTFVKNGILILACENKNEISLMNQG